MVKDASPVRRRNPGNAFILPFHGTPQTLPSIPGTDVKQQENSMELFLIEHRQFPLTAPAPKELHGFSLLRLGGTVQQVLLLYLAE